MNQTRERSDSGDRRAIILHAGALGDTLLMFVFAKALKPLIERRISIVARGEFLSLLECAADYERFNDIDTGGFHALFADDAPLPANLCEAMEQVELVVNMLPDSEGTVARRLGSLGVRKVFDIDTRPRDTFRGHIVEQWIGDFFRAAELCQERGPLVNSIISSPTPTIQLSDESIRAGRKILEAAVGARGSRLSLLIHPGSGGRSKNWPIERFIALAGAWQSAGHRAAFLIGPVEQEQLAPMILSNMARTAPLVGSNDLREVAACLLSADCVLSNDSGISHLAAAVGGRVVAIFGPTDPVTWRPVGSRVMVVREAGGWPTTEQVLMAVTEHFGA